MLIGSKGAQGKGKTLTMVGLVLVLWQTGGYKPEEFFGNVSILLPGFHWCAEPVGCAEKGYHRIPDKATFREFIRYVFDSDRRHLVIVADEIDALYPSRFFKDRAQTEELLNLWQDEKRFLMFLYTCHLGTSIDTIIRKATQIVVIPDYSRETDSVDLFVINNLDLETHEDAFLNVSKLLFPLYDRWELIR